MFNLCKSRYQAVLLKQRWNELSQQYAKYQIAGEICVPSALNWNYLSYILKNKSCSVIIQRALYKRHTAKEKWWPKRGPYQYGPPVRIVYKDNFKNLFQMTVFFLAYVVTFLGQVHFMRSFYEKLPFSEHSLLLSGYSLRLFLFGAKLLPTATSWEEIVLSGS